MVIYFQCRGIHGSSSTTSHPSRRLFSGVSNPLSTSPRRSSTPSPGYAGGHKCHTENPSYEAVCTGETGHAEVVRINFNPDEISFRQFSKFSLPWHDPTPSLIVKATTSAPNTALRYSSTTNAQRQDAKLSSLKSMPNQIYGNNPVVTLVEPLSKKKPTTPPRGNTTVITSLATHKTNTAKP